MTTNDVFNDRLADWLRDDAERRVPDHLAEVLVSTAATRQRRWWSSPERWLPMDIASYAGAVAPMRFGRLIIVGLLLVVIAAVAIVAVGSRTQRVPPPFGPALNGQILSEDRDDIFVAAADGSNHRPLVVGPERDIGAWHSHDGTRFIFVRTDGGIDYQLLIANADGSGIRPLLDQPLTQPDKIEWSPTDDRLAIVHGVHGRRVLSILDLASGAVRDLPVPALSVDYDVQWRPPNGDELVFTARREPSSSRFAAVYAIRPDGSGFRTVVPERPEDWPFLGLEFSPDGRTLTYWMYEAIPGEAAPHARVHLVDMATNQDRQVVFDAANLEESELHFSPDGRSGVILSATDHATLQLVSLEPIGPGPAIGPRLAGDEAKSAGFSPDGTKVVLAIDNSKPMFIDVGTRSVTTLNEVWGRLDSWQRLAP